MNDPNGLFGLCHQEIRFDWGAHLVAEAKGVVFTYTRKIEFSSILGIRPTSVYQ
jgi:hypothetical protein